MEDEKEDEEIEESEGSEAEIKIPEEIKIDWSGKSDEEEEEELEGIIEAPPASFVRRMDAEQINPFLEATEQPVENLEQDLQDVPGATEQTVGEEGQGELADYEVVNAPQYSAGYETNYETMRRGPEDAEMDMGGGLMRREADIKGIGMPDRRIDFARWQHTHAEGGAEPQEKYQVREPKKLGEEDKLPFQRKRKRLF